MNQPTRQGFGIVMAFTLPGFVVLASVEQYFPGLADLIWGDHDDGLAGFLYATLFSSGTGLFVSAVRWLTIDCIHHCTGIPPRPINFALVAERVDAFRMFVEDNYRFYQFYANTFVAICGMLVSQRLLVGWNHGIDSRECILLATLPILFVGSRDSLRRYYCRISQILSRPTEVMIHLPASHR